MLTQKQSLNNTGPVDSAKAKDVRFTARCTVTTKSPMPLPSIDFTLRRLSLRRCPLAIPTLTTTLFVLGVLVGCQSTNKSTGSASIQSKGSLDSSRTERVVEQIEESPDSLATLPRPLFHEESLTSSVAAVPKPVGTVDTSSHARITVVGGTVDGHAQWGLLVRASHPDSSLLRPFSFVDLYSKELAMRRGQAWRTLSVQQDSIVDTRYIPLSPRDLQRLARTDTVKLDVNHGRYHLPLTFQSTLNQLYRAVPDSLRLSPTGVEAFFTIYKVVDTKPSMKESIEAFASDLDEEYPTSRSEAEAVVRFIVQEDGTVRPLEPLTGGPPAFVNAVLRVLPKQKFSPGRVNGKPVPTLMTNIFTINIRSGAMGPGFPHRTP